MSLVPRYGNPNDELLTSYQHAHAAEQMGAECLRAVGIDPERYSPSYLRGCAMRLAQILGRHYAGPGFLEARTLTHHDLETFTNATRCCP